MKKAYKKRLIIIVGILFVISSLAMLITSFTYLILFFNQKPIRDTLPLEFSVLLPLGMVFLVLGIGLIIIGNLSIFKRPLVNTNEETIKCPNCGKHKDIDSVYCKYCGYKFK